jgi:hypothetical protein
MACLSRVDPVNDNLVVSHLQGNFVSPLFMLAHGQQQYSQQFRQGRLPSSFWDLLFPGCLPGAMHASGNL